MVIWRNKKHNYLICMLHRDEKGSVSYTNQCVSSTKNFLSEDDLDFVKRNLSEMEKIPFDYVAIVNVIKLY